MEMKTGNQILIETDNYEEFLNIFKKIWNDIGELEGEGNVWRILTNIPKEKEKRNNPRISILDEEYEVTEHLNDSPFYIVTAMQVNEFLEEEEEKDL